MCRLNAPTNEPLGIPGNTLPGFGVDNQNAQIPGTSPSGISLPGLSGPSVAPAPVSVPTKFGKLVRFALPILSNGMTIAGQNAPPGTFLRGYGAGGRMLPYPTNAELNPIPNAPQMPVRPGPAGPPIGSGGPPSMSDPNAVVPPGGYQMNPLTAPANPIMPVARQLPPNFGGGANVRPEWETTPSGGQQEFLVNTDQTSPDYLKKTPVASAPIIPPPPTTKTAIVTNRDAAGNESQSIVDIDPSSPTFGKVIKAGISSKAPMPKKPTASDLSSTVEQAAEAAMDRAGQDPNKAIQLVNGLSKTDPRLLPLMRQRIREMARPGSTKRSYGTNDPTLQQKLQSVNP